MRRFDEPIKAGIRYKHRPGVYGVLQRGDRILLTFQSLPEPEFQLPGGGIDPGETLQSALHREVREETGWSMAIRRRLGVFQRYTYMPEYDLWARKICHIYLCRPARSIEPPREADHSAHWFSQAEAMAILANGGDRFFVASLF